MKIKIGSEEQKDVTSLRLVVGDEEYTVLDHDDGAITVYLSSVLSGSRLVILPQAANAAKLMALKEIRQ